MLIELHAIYLKSSLMKSIVCESGVSVFNKIATISRQMKEVIEFDLVRRSDVVNKDWLV